MHRSRPAPGTHSLLTFLHPSSAIPSTRELATVTAILWGSHSRGKPPCPVSPTSRSIWYRTIDPTVPPNPPPPVLTLYSRSYIPRLFHPPGSSLLFPPSFGEATAVGNRPVQFPALPAAPFGIQALAHLPPFSLPPPIHPNPQALAFDYGYQPYIDPDFDSFDGPDLFQCRL